MIEWFYEVIWPFIDWSDNSSLAVSLKASHYAFPVIEAFHLVAFSVLGGTILLTDLRLLGLIMKAQPVARLARDARPWMVWSLVFMLISGTFLYFTEPMKLYYSNAFWIKMLGLVLAMIFSVTVRRWVLYMDEDKIGPIWGRVTALVSLVLWGTVAWGGRWIGFS